MGRNTTIAIRKETYNKLLGFTHKLEKERGCRVYFSDAIEHLLEGVK